MKYWLSSILLFLLAFVANAQKTHTVAAKESYTSIGRLYEVNGRVLAEFNNLDYEKGLSIGQVIKIPAKSGNAPSATAVQPPVVKPIQVNTHAPANTAAAGNEVYHVVAPKETLYGLSKKYNVSIDDLKKWNNLSADGFSIGAKVIVGYDKQNAAAVVKEPVVEPKPVIPTKPAEKPVVKEPVIEKPIVKEPVVIPEPTKPAPSTVEPVKETRNKPDFYGGIFKSSYESNNTSTESGKAGVFKSNSGWEDGRYYCLQNTALQGSIAKITNNSNGKTIYAKVLDVIPDIKQNQGLVVRVSNAAAAELGVDSNQFDCTITYIK